MTRTHVTVSEETPESCQEDIRDIRDNVDTGVLLSNAGLLAALRGPGQPQGEAQGEIQDQEEQQQRGAAGEAEGEIMMIAHFSSYLILLEI